MKKIVLAVCFLIIGQAANAQWNPFAGSRDGGFFKWYDGNRDGSRNGSDSRGDDFGLRNIVKINLSSLPLSNYSAQYERVLNARISFCIGARYMPLTKLIGGLNTKDFGIKDSLFSGSFSGLTTQNFALTPELRVYLSKQAGKGFYIGPMIRYENYKLNVPFSSTLNNGKPLIGILNGDLNSFGGGFQIGTQFNLGKRIVLDWWMFGPYAASRTMTLKASSSTYSFSTTEIAEIEDRFAVDNYLVALVPTITANSITLKTNSLFPAVRTGFCIGFRF
jgi:hypothetical protein